MIEPTSTSPGTQVITIREWEAWQKAQSNEAVLRQRMLEEARDGLEKLVAARFDAVQMALSLALDEHQRQHKIEAETLLRERAMVREYLDKIRAADQMAIAKAEESVNKRLEAMNELRAQITSERGEFVRNDTYSARHDELITRISALENGQVGISGQVAPLAPLPGQIAVLREGASNLQGRIAVAAAVTGVVVTVAITVVVIIVNILTSKGV